MTAFSISSSFVFFFIWLPFFLKSKKANPFGFDESPPQLTTKFFPVPWRLSNFASGFLAHLFFELLDVGKSSRQKMFQVFIPRDKILILLVLNRKILFIRNYLPERTSEGRTTTWIQIIFFAFFTDKNRRTDSRIQRKKSAAHQDSNLGFPNANRTLSWKELYLEWFRQEPAFDWTTWVSNSAEW